MTRRAPTLPGWPRLLSLELAAAYCCVSPNHFSLHYTGPSITMGSRVLYHRDDVEAYQDRLRGAPEGKDWREELRAKKRAAGRSPGRGEGSGVLLPPGDADAAAGALRDAGVRRRAGAPRYQKAGSHDYDPWRLD